jgi:hypothetical protein
VVFHVEVAGARRFDIVDVVESVTAARSPDPCSRRPAADRRENWTGL